MLLCFSLDPAVLTRIPVQLWALLNFADGRQFFDQKGFKEQFGDLKGSSQVCSLPQSAAEHSAAAVVTTSAAGRAADSSSAACRAGVCISPQRQREYPQLTASVFHVSPACTVQQTEVGDSRADWLCILPTLVRFALSVFGRFDGE